MTFSIIVAYLGLLLFLGIFSTRLLRFTAGDYFLASRGIGPFMLLMSIFGTTMTAFALIGSTGKTFEKGVGVYGLMASWSGIIHSVVFFLVGARVWALGKKHGYVTQLAYFRDRYRSDGLALLLFPLVVSFVVLYILMGVIGAGRVLQGITAETFSLAGSETRLTLAATPEDLSIPYALKERVIYDAAQSELVLKGSFAPKRKAQLVKCSQFPAWKKAIRTLFDRNVSPTPPTGAIPYPVGMAIICVVVLLYVFLGGMRATAWANTMQTLVFMVMGLVAFLVITRALGGPVAATEMLEAKSEEAASRMARQGLLGKLQFLTYCFIPLSVGMFPHLFQHWLTARRGSNFKLTVVAHPICIMITWVPCVLLGMWAAGVLPLPQEGVPGSGTDPNKVLPMMVSRFSGEALAGLIGAGILAAIMSSMDSQFLCLSSLFTNDIVAHHLGKDRLSDRRRVLLGRGFVIAIVAISYSIGLTNTQSVFDLGVWCFTGFASLFPVLFASLYWKRSNRQGAIASVLTVAVLWLAFLPSVLGKKAGEEFLIFGMMPVTFIIALSTLVLVVVTLLTPPPDPATVEKFFPAAGRFKGRSSAAKAS